MKTTIDAMEDAIMKKIHYWYDSQETDAPQEMGALRSGIRAAIAREEAQTAIDKFVSSQESSGLTSDQIDELVFGEAQTVEPVVCKSCGIPLGDLHMAHTNCGWPHRVIASDCHPAPPPSGDRAAHVGLLRMCVEHLRATGQLVDDEGEVTDQLEQAADMLAADAQREDNADDLSIAYMSGLHEGKKRAQQVAVPQVFALSTSGTKAELLERIANNEHRIGSAVGLCMDNSKDDMQSTIRLINKQLSAAPKSPQAERVPMTDAVIDACMQDVAAAALAGIGLPHDKVDAQAPLVVKFAKENLQSYFAVLAARGKS